MRPPKPKQTSKSAKTPKTSNTQRKPVHMISTLKKIQNLLLSKTKQAKSKTSEMTTNQIIRNHILKNANANIVVKLLALDQCPKPSHNSCVLNV